MNSKQNIDIFSMIRDLENDYINGSSVIALNGLQIFVDAIEIYSESEDFNFKIEMIAKKIIKSKPAMASLGNLINFALQEMLSSINDSPQMIFQKTVREINLAKKITLNNAINFIRNKQFSNIITCSYSSTVLNLISELKLLGFDFNVIILESVWNGIKFCKNLKKECDNINISSRIVNKESIPKYDFAIVGADSIIKSKGIINGVPSKYLAENSFNSNLPFYVIGESYKNSSNIFLQDGFEFIENRLINNIFSDNIF